MTADGSPPVAGRGEFAGKGEHPPYLVVGHLNKAHGVRGEVFVWPLTDYPRSHFAPGVVHHQADEAGRAPSATASPLVLESVRPYRKGYLAKFVGIEDRTSADALRGRYLLRPFESIDPSKDGEVFYHELLGAEVATVNGTSLGRVKEVYPLRPADLLEVAGPGGETLVPLSPQVVVSFDRKRRRMVVDPPPGLLS